VQRSEGKFLSSGGSRHSFFLDQPTRNKIPTRNAGTTSIRDTARAIYHGSMVSLTMENIMCAMPARMNAIPPTISYFHDTHRTIARIKEGMLCMNRPTAICQPVNPGSKTSNENTIKKRINIIANILGIQYTYLFIFFSIPRHQDIFIYKACYLTDSSEPPELSITHVRRPERMQKRSF